MFAWGWQVPQPVIRSAVFYPMRKTFTSETSGALASAMMATPPKRTIDAAKLVITTAISSTATLAKYYCS